MAVANSTVTSGSSHLQRRVPRVIFALLHITALEEHFENTVSLNMRVMNLKNYGKRELDRINTLIAV
jgi:hypothetical protein